MYVFSQAVCLKVCILRRFYSLLALFTIIIEFTCLEDVPNLNMN